MPLQTDTCSPQVFLEDVLKRCVGGDYWFREKKKSISAAGADRRDISCTVNRENHQAMNCSPFLIIQRGPHEQGSSLTSFHDVVFDE